MGSAQPKVVFQLCLLADVHPNWVNITGAGGIWLVNPSLLVNIDNYIRWLARYLSTVATIAP